MRFRYTPVHLATSDVFAVGLSVRLQSVYRWPLWGVLLTGAVSSLLCVRASELLTGRLALLVTLLIALPIIGGALSPEKPAYTVAVFGISSFSLPTGLLTDIPPIPIGLWPLVWVSHVLHNTHSVRLAERILADLAGALMIFTIAVCLNSLGFAPSVYLGWAIRLKCFLRSCNPP